MGRLRRSQRVAAITRTLVNRPASYFSLGFFSQMLDAAKSTISEDLALMKEAFGSLGLGKIETLTGATGGVRYLPCVWSQDTHDTLERLCHALSDPSRILPGGFLYMADLIFDPSWAQDLGEIFATRFWEASPDVVVTVETKGIPLAMMTARSMGLPLVVVRRDHRVTEGSALSINYVSGSSHRIQTMSLPRRALQPGAKVLAIDDFMKAGGTARGIVDLMGEFGASVVGMGVLVETEEPRDKLVSDYTSLAILLGIDEASKRVTIKPAPYPRGS